eukprot:gene46318-3456_t
MARRLPPADARAVFGDVLEAVSAAGGVHGVTNAVFGDRR